MDSHQLICYTVLAMFEREPPGIQNRGHDDQEHTDLKPLFRLGQIVGTQGALRALTEARQHPVELLARHVTGDWGDLPEEDREENRLSVEKGYRVFSSYRLQTGTKVWVITEWDRSVTTLLLPSEY